MPGLTLRHQDINPTQLTDQPQDFLSRSNIRDEQMLHRAGDPALRRVKQAHQSHGLMPGANPDAEPVSNIETKLSGSTSGNQAGGRLGQKGRKVVVGSRTGAAEIRTEGRFRKRVNSEQMKNPTGIVCRGDITFYHGCKRPDFSRQPQTAVHLLGYAIRPADDLMRRPSDDALGCQHKGPTGTLVCHVNRHHDRHTKGNTEQRQTDLPGMVLQIAAAGTPQQPTHPAASVG